MRTDMSRLAAEVADGSTAISNDLLAEVEGNLRFQAEVAQYKKLRRAMRSLRLDLVEPGPDLALEVLALLDDEPDRARLTVMAGAKKAATVGALAAATAAGVGSVIVLARRRFVA